jgi:hypothetical protein
MSSRIVSTLVLALVGIATLTANAQSFRVQCPTSTITHPSSLTNVNAEPNYSGPTALTCTVANGCGGTAGNVGYLVPSTGTVNGAIKCQQVSGGDGYSTMANGTQTFMFSFGPLSGLADIANGLPGTQYPASLQCAVYHLHRSSTSVLLPGDPATTDGQSWQATGRALSPLVLAYNGAVGIVPDIANLVTIYDIAESTAGSGNTVVVQTNAPLGVQVGQVVNVCGTGTYTVAPAPPCGTGTETLNGYDGQFLLLPLTRAPPRRQLDHRWRDQLRLFGPNNFTYTLPVTNTGLAEILESQTATVATPPVIDGHVDPRQIMDVGVMNGNIPAPLVAFDEDDEMFLTLTNVGMIMRPDLFEQHTIHFHGYPNASSVYDGVPDASVAINIGGSFTYYYLPRTPARTSGTAISRLPSTCRWAWSGNFMYGHGRIAFLPAPVSTPAWDTRMGIGLPGGQPWDLRTACNPANDILCSATMPAINTGAVQGTRQAWQPAKVRLQRRRRLNGVRRRVSPPDSRLRPQLPLCRHDLQPGSVCGYEETSSSC